MKQRVEKNSLTDNRIKTFSRGLLALEQVCRSDGGTTQSELARSLGVDRSTALRFLATLVGEGYAWRDETGAYHPTMKLAELAGGVVENLELRRLAHPKLRQLTEDTGLSAHLAVLSERRIVYVDGLHGPGMVRVNAAAGTVAPVHCSATGKALAAFLEHETRGKVLDGYLDGAGRFSGYTGRTITDPALLLEELERIRRIGYAMDDEEYEPGVRCLAAPVFDLNNKVLATVGVSGTTARLAGDLCREKAALVCAAADSISWALGCANPRRPAGLEVSGDGALPQSEPGRSEFDEP